MTTVQAVHNKLAAPFGKTSIQCQVALTITFLKPILYLPCKLLCYDLTSYKVYVVHGKELEVGTIVSQRSSLEFASLVTKAGSSPQNLRTYGLFYMTLVPPRWLSAQAIQECIDYELKAGCTTGFLSITPLTYYSWDSKVGLL